MGQVWYCLIDGRQSGPLTVNQLRTLVHDRRLLPTNSVRLDSMNDWIPASRVKGLFPNDSGSCNKIADQSKISVPRWFIHDGEHELGPFSDSELLQRATAGKVRPEHDIRRTDHLDWVKAAQVKGLFAPISHTGVQSTDTAIEAPKIKFVCPSCGKCLSANTKHAREIHKCPACRSQVAIPTSSQPTSVPPPAPSAILAATNSSLANATSDEPTLIQSVIPSVRAAIPIAGLSFRKIFSSLATGLAPVPDEKVPREAIIFYGREAAIDFGRGILWGPLVYATGQRFQCVHDASLIELPLPASSRNLPDRLPYWPSYHDCTPAQRSLYLDWLYGGRCDPNIEIGYVFLFFYGLERRVLVDGKDHETIVEELLRLLSIYPKSRSFLNYATSLLWLTIFLSAKHGGLPHALVLHAFQSTTRWNDDALRYSLSYFFRQNLPLPVEIAYAVAGRDERSPSSVVSHRHSEQFSSLFSTRFLQRFPNGLILKCGKRDQPISYRPGSASLLRSNEPLPELRDQTLLDLPSRNQYSPLVEIWSECVEDLRKFDRASRHTISSSMTAEMYEALPRELRTIDHPELDRWQKAISENMDDKGWAVLPLSRLAEIKSYTDREELTKSQCTAILSTADALGMAIEPDARQTAKNYSWDEKVIVFREQGDRGDDGDWNSYRSAAILLQLGLAIANADNQIDQVELDRISTHLEQQFNLGQRLTKRLDALKHLLSMNGIDDLGIARKLQKTLTLPQRQLVGEFLVGIALADNVITSDERRALGKAYRNLGIPSEQLVQLLAKHESLNVEESESANTSAEQYGYTHTVLDLERIRTIREETSRVQEMLHNVLASADHSADQSEISDHSPIGVADYSLSLATADDHKSALAIPSGSAVNDRSDPLLAVAGVAQYQDKSAVLPARYQLIYSLMIGRREWMRSDLIVLARQYGLMLNATLEALNEWSMEAFGDWLVEEAEEKVIIHTELLERA